MNQLWTIIHRNLKPVRYTGSLFHCRFVPTKLPLLPPRAGIRAPLVMVLLRRVGARTQLRVVRGLLLYLVRMHGYYVEVTLSGIYLPHCTAASTLLLLLWRILRRSVIIRGSALLQIPRVIATVNLTRTYGHKGDRLTGGSRQSSEEYQYRYWNNRRTLILVLLFWPVWFHSCFGCTLATLVSSSFSF